MAAPIVANPMLWKKGSSGPVASRNADMYEGAFVHALTPGHASSGQGVASLSTPIFSTH